MGSPWDYSSSHIHHGGQRWRSCVRSTTWWCRSREVHHQISNWEPW